MSNKINEGFSEHFCAVTDALRSDPGYYIAWQSNMAMTFVDVLGSAGYRFPELHKLANDAAKTFIDMLIDKGKPEDKK